MFLSLAIVMFHALSRSFQMNRSLLLTLVLSVGLSSVGCKKKEEGSGAAASASADSPGLIEKVKEAVSNEVTLKPKAPAVGMKRQVDESSETNMQIKMGAREMNIVEKETAKRVEEVMAVEGNTITKMKVTYEIHSKESTEGGKTRKTPDLLAGKSFLLESVKGKVNVTTDAGKPVAGPAKNALLKEYKTFGQQDKVEAALANRPLKIGEPVTGLDEVMTEQLKAAVDDGRSGIVVDPPKMTLKRKDGDFAVFEMAATVKMTKGMMKGLVIDTSGEIFIHTTDSRSTKTNTSGTMALSPEEQSKNKGLSLSGTIKQNSVASPL